MLKISIYLLKIIMKEDNQIYVESAQYYDLISKDTSRINYTKNFNDFLILASSIGIHLTNFLDYGCGTGTFAILFAQKDLQVNGIDLSAKQFEIAKEKIRTLGLESKVKLFVENMVDFKISEQFDAAGSFFSPFCYLLTDKEVLAFLENAYTMVKSGGILFFEFWNSYAVKPDLQSFLVAKEGGLTVYRFNNSFFDIKTGIITMPMSHIVIKDREVISEFTETHKLRTYTIAHLTTLIAQSKWKIVDVYAKYYNLPQTEKEPKLDDFRLYAVLRK